MDLDVMDMTVWVLAWVAKVQPTPTSTGTHIHDPHGVCHTHADAYAQCVLDTTNRYFTCRHQHNESPMVPFLLGVDPNNILAQVTSDQYSHLEDNRVMFHKLDEEYSRYDKTRVKTSLRIDDQLVFGCELTIFRLGDLVEASFLIMTFTINPQSTHMQLVLCSFALVNLGQTTVQMHAQISIECLC